MARSHLVLAVAIATLVGAPGPAAGYLFEGGEGVSRMWPYGPPPTGRATAYVPPEEARRALQGARLAIDGAGDAREVLTSAKRQLERVVAVHDEYADAYVALARIEYRLARRRTRFGLMYDPDGIARTHELVARALWIEPRNYDALIWSAYAFAADGGRLDSDAQLARALVAAPERGEVDLVRAAVAESFEDPAGAVRHYQAALGKSLDRGARIDAYAALADLYRRWRSPDRAVDALRALLEIEPAHEPALIGHVRALSEAGRYDEAIASADALEDSPRPDLRPVLLADVYFFWGAALYRQGQLMEAKHRLTVALHINPDQPGAHNLLAFVYAGEAAEATTLEGALALLDRAEVHYERYIGLTHGAFLDNPTLKRIEQAKSTLRRAW